MTKAMWLPLKRKFVGIITCAYRRWGRFNTHSIFGLVSFIKFSYYCTQNHITSWLLVYFVVVVFCLCCSAFPSNSKHYVCRGNNDVMWEKACGFFAPFDWTFVQQIKNPEFSACGKLFVKMKPYLFYKKSTKKASLNLMIVKFDKYI